MNDPEEARPHAGGNATGAAEPSGSRRRASPWAEVTLVTNRRDRADALLRQAEIAAAASGRADEALALRRRALLSDPYHPSALTALALHARASRDWVLLALLQARRFAIAEVGSDRAELALDLARIEHRELHNPAAAREWNARGVEAAPDDPELCLMLRDLARDSGDRGLLLEQLEQVIRVRGEDAPIDVLIEAASLHAELGAAHRALHCLQRATARNPENVAVVDALALLLAKLGRHADLADALERRIALSTGEPKLCAARLARLGALHESRLFDPDAALEAFERAHALDAEAIGVADALVRLRAKVDGRSDPGSGVSPGAVSALAAYEREAIVTNDRERLGELIREIERLHARLGTPDQALRWVQRWIAVAPEEPDALRALARLHDRPGQEPRLAVTLEALDPLLEPTEQLANRQRIAALYAALVRHEDAERAFALALELDPSDLTALAGRADALRVLGRFAELIAALEQLAAWQPATERLETRLELARIHEQRDDISRAIAVLGRVEAEDGASGEVSEQLDGLLLRMLRHEELEERLARRAAGYDPGTAEAVALDLRRAAILLDPLERPEDAAAVYRRVLAHAPESREARAGVERALRSSVDAAGLAAFLEDQEARATDPADKGRLALERAVLLDELLDCPEEALAIFARLAVASDAPEVLRDAERRCEQILERLERWSALRDHLLRRLGRHSDVEDARLHERLARLCADRLDDDAGEIEHLERVVSLTPERDDVWQKLARHYEREDRVEEWVRALEALVANGPDHGRELDLRARLAELYQERLPRPEAARVHYERVFELCPSHSAAAQFLVNAYEDEARFEDVIRLLETRLASIDATTGADPLATNRRTALRLQIAHVREARLDDLEGAISALEVALGEVGPEAVIAEPLAAAYQRGGYSADLLDLCRQATAASQEPAERANWLVRMGDVHLSSDQPREAADAYRRALIERPGDRAIEASLRELYRAMGRIEPLVELLESELRHLAGTAEIPVRLELVERLRATHPENALVHARRVLQLAARHRGAVEAAVAIAESLGRPEDALAILDARIAASPSDYESAEWQIRRARLLAGPLARNSDAIDSYRAALGADPSGGQASELLSLLSDLLEREQRWSEWLDCRARLVRQSPPSDRADLVDRAARVAWEQISPEAALPWLERLRCERPDCSDVRKRISLAHRELGHDEALLRALRAEAEASDRSEERQRCHLERAALLRAAGATGRALSALADAGPVPEALRIRESLERELRLHAQRATTLEALLALSGSDLALHRELALLYSTELASPDAAVRHWEAARKLVPSGGAAGIEILRALAAAERSAGRTGSWARHAEEELAALDPAPVFDDRRRELRRELTIAYDEELARPDAALAHLRALLDAGDVELLGRETLDRIELACLRLLRTEENPVELERRLAHRLERVGGDAPEWLELAGIREETLHRTSAAQDAYRKALECAPSNLDALRGLRRAAERLGRWRDVADALERELETAAGRDATDRGALLRALGDLHWHRLQSTTRASRYYAAALEANASDFAALRALERLLEAMEDWRGALDLYESEVEVLGSANPRRRREIWLHVASLARERAEDPERARQALRRAGEIEPLETPRLAELAALHESVDDREAFASTFASWCDAPDAGASAADHLRVALALEALGRLDAAVARIETAVSTDPEHPAAWDAAARLRAAAGDLAGSAQALRSAAQYVDDADASQRLHEAATRLCEQDPEAALGLLRTAVERRPDSAPVQAARARIAAQLGKDEEAELAAAAVLESGDPGTLAATARAAAARTGAEAARRRGRVEAAASLYAEALQLDPDDAATLSAYGEILIALGDHPSARRALERRLAGETRYPERGAHCALLGHCLELAGEPEEALVHYEATLCDNPSHVEALESVVRVLESLDRIEPGVKAIERWARAARASDERALRLLRAAQWELRRGGRQASAERHLRSAVAADASQAKAWLALAALQIELGRLDDGIETADRAATHVHDPIAFAALANLQGRAYEQKGARHEAAIVFGIAAECDPRCADAALAQARLLRGFGEWRDAAATLATFAERHPSDHDATLADVYEQLGRLRAGPLEDLEGAVLSYRRAIELAPERLDVRASLAELLSHRPGDWDEALEHHRIVLANRPTHSGCLRVALRIARGRGDPARVATGVAIQRALGIATAYESEADACDAAPLVTREPELSDARFETLRRLAVEAANEIANALGGAVPAPENAPSEDPVVTFRSRVLAVQGELSAPALLMRSTRDVREVMQLLVKLVLEPSHVSGDGNLVNSLSESLGRRRRRKLRRILGENVTPDDFSSVDFEEWRVELRALAAAETVRRDATPLRTAIVALVAEGGAMDVRGETHLAPQVEAEPSARALMRRVVDDWLERL